MKLDQLFAKKNYDSICSIYASKNSLLNKLTGKPGLSYIFQGMIKQLTLNQTLENNKAKLEYIFNSEKNPGESFKKETNALSCDLYAFYQKKKVPTEADLKNCVKRLAQFIAFYTDSEVPKEVSKIWSENNQLTIDDEDLIDNPTTRIPVVLCLDTSGSMQGDPINELSKGVKAFFDSVVNDEIAKYSVELCIITFDSSVKKLLDFSSIDKQINQFNRVKLVASGLTSMGTAVNMAIDLLEERKKKYKDNGVDYWQPWLVLMTDGQPTESKEVIEKAYTRTADLVNNKKLTVFPIAIGDGANMVILNHFSPQKNPIRLKGLCFTEFFTWLGKSVKITSQSAPGTKVKLPSVDSWAYL